MRPRSDKSYVVQVRLGGKAWHGLFRGSKDDALEQFEAEVALGGDVRLIRRSVREIVLREGGRTG